MLLRIQTNCRMLKIFLSIFGIILTIAEGNGKDKPTKLSQIMSSAILKPQPLAPLSPAEPPEPEIEIMDFYVPRHPADGLK